MKRGRKKEERRWKENWKERKQGGGEGRGPKYDTPRGNRRKKDFLVVSS